MEEVLLQTQWGWQIALYLFFGGLAGGTLLVVGCLDFKKGRPHDAVVRTGAWVSVALLVVGVVMLVTETLMPFRAMLLWQSFSNLSSWMALGAWLLVFTVAAAVLFAASKTPKLINVFSWLEKGSSVFRVLAMVSGTCVAMYTGVLLSVLEAHPLWDTWLIPVLFTVSAIDTGVSLVMGRFALVRTCSQAAESAKRILGKTAVQLIFLESIVLAALMATVGVSSGVGAASVALLATGALAVPFWGLVVALGLALPLVIDVFLLGNDFGKPDTVRNMALASSAFCLVGGCALRFLILMAGLPAYA